MSLKIMSFVQILVVAYIIKLINIVLCCIMVNPSKDYFLYFAYGSNLLKRRIHIKNPSAVFVGIGRLDNHQLDFAKYNKLWDGAVASVVPNDKEHVWGAVWRLNTDSVDALDSQEGVGHNEYFPKLVEISTTDGMTAKCRTYQHVFNPPIRKADEPLPEDRRPSITYKECIIRGAVECNIPEDYIAKLRQIPTNGKHATAVIRNRLNL